ncbi:MAG: hypothetical protein HZB30_08290 [Nitrospirae bacterium]|nr:hypothetical protein [Nitrospirota bacterium]
MKDSKSDPEELKKEDPGSGSTLGRRNFLEMGLLATVVFAGDAFLSVISWMDNMLSSTEGPKEDL